LKHFISFCLNFELRCQTRTNYTILGFSGQREMWALVRKPIPLRSNWSPPTLQYATRVFLEKIIDGLYGPGTRSLVTVRKSKHNQGEKARESGCMFVCF
jgi:hypothetical protein